MKKKGVISKIMSIIKNDWTITSLLLIVLLLLFFVSEQEYMQIINLTYIIAGTIGLIYICYAIYFLCNPIKLDLIWRKNNFLHKVVNLVLLVPFTMTMFFIICNVMAPNSVEEKENITEGGESLARELIFSETIYEEDIDTIDIGEGSLASKEPSLFWAVYYHYIDPGNQHIATSNSGRRWATFIAVLGYFLLNGLLVAVLIGYFDRRRQRWEYGEVEYGLLKIKKHHIIIGANDMVHGMVKKMLEKYPSDYILIQTCKNVDLFRRELFSDLEKEKQEKIIIYYGNRNSKNDVQKLCLKKAGDICILGESLTVDGYNHDAFNMDCLRLITDILPDGIEKKNVYVIFENQITFSSFQFSDITSVDKEKINYMPYNYYEIWTQRTFALPDPTGILDDEKDNKKGYAYLPLDTIREFDEQTQEEKLSYISKDDPHYVHLVIIGMTKMGAAMGIEAAHLAHYPNALTSKGPRTRITFIDENADRESGYFMNRYSAMFDLARWRYAEADKFNQRIKTEEDKDLYSDFSMDDATWHDPLYDDNSTSPYKNMKLGVDGTNDGDEFFVDLEWEFIKGDMSNYSVLRYLRECADRKKHPNKILTIAVCLDEPHQSIAAGLYMPDAVYENALQILVYQRFSDSILNYIEDSALKDKNVKYRNVKPFGMLRDTFSMISTDDYLAKCTNYIYTYTDYSNGDNKKIYDKENDVLDVKAMENIKNEWIDECWNEALADFRKGKSGCASRWSSIYNANTIRTKLRSIKWDGFELDKGNDDLVNAMAMTEHNRWNVEQLLMHYSLVNADELQELERLNHTDKNEHKKMKDKLKQQMRHVDICSYSRLQEVDSGVKIYDISISRSLPYFVKKYKDKGSKDA